MKTSTLITMLVGIGVAGAATFASPSAAPAVAAGFGGSLCGATLLSGRKKDEEAEKVESARVAKTFSFLYETNRGMISPSSWRSTPTSSPSGQQCSLMLWLMNSAV
jgi:hypothetical protein